mgnify:CR=1 FL=1
MTDSERAQRREIYYEGHVQGVGFRYTARSVAAGFPVAGFVRNLRDGRVLLVAEGEPADLDGFFGRLESELGRHIRHRSVEVRGATGEFRSFDIRF